MRKSLTNIPKECTIRWSPYSLESLSLSQGLSSRVLTPRVRQVPKLVRNESFTLGTRRFFFPQKKFVISLRRYKITFAGIY
jgi:hypothetical protein